MEEYRSKIKPYLKDIINDLKISDRWKIQLTTINLVSSKDDNNEKCEMHEKHENIKIMMNYEADEVIEELFQSLKKRYQSYKNKQNVDYVHYLYYKCHKINPNSNGSYRDSPDWIKNKNATINSINQKDNKCFQCAITVTLNPGEIKKDLQGITKIKLFINKYNWKGINIPSEKKLKKKIEKNNVTIALIVLYAKK